MTRFTRFAVSIIVPVVLSLALLVSIELVVRLAFPKIPGLGVAQELILPDRFGQAHGLAPNQTFSFLGGTMVTDGNGFRIDTERDHGNVMRWVFVLGDSITMLPGVEADAAFPFLIDRSSPAVGVINAAVVGYSFEDYISVLNHTRELPYDSIFLGISLNDLTENIVLPNDEEAPQPTDYENWLLRSVRFVNDHIIDFNRFLRVHSRTYRLVVSWVSDNGRRHFLADFSSYSDRDSRFKLDAFFQRFAEISNDRGVSVYLGIFPYEYQLRVMDEEYLLPQKVLRKAALDHGFSVFDFYDPLVAYLEESGKESADLFLFSDPMHFSETGSRAVGEIIIGSEYFAPMLGAK